MFGRASQTNDLQQETALEPESYQAHLKHNMEEIKGFVKTKVAISAKRQEENYDCQAIERSFGAGDTIWLSIPNARKLDPRWQGGMLDCAVSRIPVQLEIVNGRKRKIVHVNQIEKFNHSEQIPAAPMEQASIGVNLKFATLFTKKIHQNKVLLDILNGFDTHKIDCKVRLKDKPTIKGSSVIYCIVIDIYLYD